MLSRVCTALAVAFLMGGCVSTTLQHPLSVAEVQSFRLVDVRVSVPPQANLLGYDGIAEYAAAKRIPNYELNAATESEEFKVWTRNHLTARLKTAVQQDLSGSLAGQRPVRAEIVVRSFVLSSAVQRVVLGGDYRMTADVTLVDAKTGAALVTYPEMIYAIAAGNGWGGAIVQAAYDAANPPGDRLVKGFSEKYREWLFKTS